MEKAKMEKSTLRPPIVAVLGHVDHGKTTLLDAIRKTNVTAREAGGITQSIGASTVTTKEGKRITFIDTPGHAAFRNMRSCGANACDIAILVIASDDGVKPQTKEALECILTAKIPFIVAATKSDLPSASSELVKSSLAKEGVLFEGSGGDVPLISVSAKNGSGINELLETIGLLAEVHEVKGSGDSNLDAVVIETTKGQSGPLASIVVKNGTLKVGDEISAINTWAKVRGMFNQKGESVRQVFPGEPAQILGFSDLPKVGSKIWLRNSQQTGIQKVSEKPIEKTIVEGEIPVVIKAQNTGSLEAILASLPEKTYVVSSGVGDVNEADIFVAKTTFLTSGKRVYIFAFESKLSSSIKKLAEAEKVSLETFNIIYELFDKLEKLIKGEVHEETGKAQIVAVFPFNNKKIAGCKILAGELGLQSEVILLRSETNIGKAKVVSMRKQKNEVKIAKQGEECGLLLSPQLDFKVGDVLVCLRK